MRGAALSLTLVSTLLACGVPAPAPPPPAAPPAAAEEALSPLFDGMGSLHHPVTTRSAEAQRYFDQGLTLSYAFNHAAAEASFREAARRDPECAMCWWGVALVQGPNINAAMDPATAPTAWEALQRAQRLAAGASAKEQAYIAALARRYAAQAPEDRAPLDQAYADAMRELARAHPDDADAATLAAEALMDLHPWRYWRKDGSAEPWTGEILATLEEVMRRFPDHVGANHLWIHAVEASPHPERGVAAADRLTGLVPGAGHLVHMPGHVYFRVGRYADTIRANEAAIAADARTASACHGDSTYRLAYVPHNVHFLWAAQLMAGEDESALATARRLQAGIDPTMMRQPGLGTLQHYWAIPLYTLAVLERAQVLDEPPPPADLPYPTAVWRYARGIAQARAGRPEEAAAELAALEALTADPRLEGVTIWDINTSRDLLAVAVHALAGEIAAARGDRDGAAAILRAGIAKEDALRYDEPPPWLDPLRRRLGGVLLRLGDHAGAEAAFRDALRQHPENALARRGLEALAGG
jgi:tetratricopeptide (TPR) repeat protein